MKLWNFGNLLWKLLGLSEASFQHGWLDLSLRSPKHFEISVKAFQRVLQRTKCPSVKFGKKVGKLGRITGDLALS